MPLFFVFTFPTGIHTNSLPAVFVCVLSFITIPSSTLSFGFTTSNPAGIVIGFSKLSLAGVLAVSFPVISDNNFLSVDVIFPSPSTAKSFPSTVVFTGNPVPVFVAVPP